MLDPDQIQNKMNTDAKPCFQQIDRTFLVMLIIDIPENGRVSKGGTDALHLHPSPAELFLSLK